MPYDNKKGFQPLDLLLLVLFLVAAPRVSYVFLKVLIAILVTALFGYAIFFYVLDKREQQRGDNWVFVPHSGMGGATHSDKDQMFFEKILKQVNASAEQKCLQNKQQQLKPNCIPVRNISFLQIMGVKTYTIVTQCQKGPQQQNQKVAYPDVKPSDGDGDEVWVIFLHGAAFSSQSWVQINMLNTTAKFGFNSIALDLPGSDFDRSQSVGLIENGDKVGYLHKVISTFGIKKYVIVTPSRSGIFAIPFLKTQPEGLVGFVAVAPVQTDTLTAEDLISIKTPTFVIIGEKDHMIGDKARQILTKLPNSRLFDVPNAGHASYMENTQSFMTELFKFLLCDINDSEAMINYQFKQT